MSKSRLVTFYLWGLLLIVLVSFVWAEVLVRWTIPYRDLFEMTGRRPTLAGNEWAATDAYAAYKGRPNYSFAEDQLVKTINAHGFISTPDLSIKKPTGTIRIVFLGGSSTAGTGINLSDNETWPWRVVQSLQTRFPERQFDFINAAVGGYTTFESYGRLWSRLRFFQPDILILNHGWNEMAYFQKDVIDDILQFREGPAGDWRFERPRIRQMFAPLAIDPLIRHSQALTHLRLMWSHESQIGELTENKPVDPLDSFFDKRGLAVYRQNLQLIKSAARIMGAHLFVLKQPTLIVPNLPPELRAECGYHNHGFDHDAHVQAYAGIYAVIDREIAAADIIDLSNLSGQAKLFYDHVHPTFPLGVNAITDQVVASLSMWLKTAEEHSLNFE